MEEYLCQLRQEAGEDEGTPGHMSDTTPRAQLLALFDIVDGDDARMRGCPFQNAAVEAAGVMPAVKRIVHLHKRDYADGLVHLARQAGAGDPDAGQPGRAALRGRVCTVDLVNDPAPWARARAAAEALISMWLPLPAPRR